MVAGLALVIGGALYVYREPVGGYARTGSAYAARVACSCRFVAGRDLASCAEDKLGGMELVRLSEDDEEQSVTATFPFLASETAVYREGYGCVLEPWES